MSESDNVFFFKHKRFWLHCGLNLLIFSTVNLFLDGLFVFWDGKDVLSSESITMASAIGLSFGLEIFQLHLQFWIKCLTCLGFIISSTLLISVFSFVVPTFYLSKLLWLSLVGVGSLISLFYYSRLLK